MNVTPNRKRRDEPNATYAATSPPVPLQRVCAAVGVAPGALAGGGRAPAVSRARAGIAYLWVAGLGRPGRPLAPVLGTRPAAVYKAVQRGRAATATWDPLLKRA